MKRVLFTAIAAFALTSAASAQVLQEKNMPLTIAVKIASETIKACSAKGYNVSVAVVDRVGVLRVLMRDDKAGSHTTDTARAKAFTSASAYTPTSALVETIQKDPSAAELGHIPGFLVLGGGVPVKVGDETIGAVGVSGAPGGHLDEACAIAGIDAVKKQLK